MLSSLFRANWRTSPAHLLFLSKFIQPRSADDFDRDGGWQEVLKEPPQQAVKRLLEDAALTHSDLGGHLAFKFKVGELKEMLKQRGLSTSGKKDDLIQRLAQSDPEGMKKAVAGLMVLQCTQLGRAAVEQHLAHERDRRNKIELEVLETIRNREFEKASTHWCK